MTSTDALIHHLSADLRPVRRRHVGQETGALLALGAGELALILTTGLARPDIGSVILAPFMIWKIGSLALLAGLSGAAAIRSFAPPAQARRGRWPAAVMAALAIAAGTLVTPPAEAGRTVIERLAPVHGLLCATAITALSLPVLALLGLLMRRAAPVQPRRSAWAAGIAAATTGALVFTACCPMNDPLYITVWYALGIAAVSAAARWLLPWRFRL